MYDWVYNFERVKFTGNHRARASDITDIYHVRLNFKMVSKLSTGLKLKTVDWIIKSIWRTIGLTSVKIITRMTNNNYKFYSKMIDGIWQSKHCKQHDKYNLANKQHPDDQLYKTTTLTKLWTTTIKTINLNLRYWHTNGSDTQPLIKYLSNLINLKTLNPPLTPICTFQLLL